ncbi:MAG: AAC(3) family N-acetyltransferase [Anaerolineaceae bacterium]|nr:AAC(3) family N-acetyltransferase [Anaerolineaceae bacterium]
MPDIDVIKATKNPLTIPLLVESLHACGVQPGQTILVHTALSKLGWIVGGVQAYIMALLEAVGEQGTIMMPTQTGDLTDPKEWQNPPIPESWWQLHRDYAPAYDPQVTPTRGMGRVPELFRVWPGVQRSANPVVSFAAHGPNADYLLADHSLTDELGEQSPLGKLYALDGHVLLIGVDHFNNTSLHLAEYRTDYPGKSMMKTGSPMLVDGQRQWVEYEVLNTGGDDFGLLGKAFDQAHDVRVQRIGNADVRFFHQRPLVDFACKWMAANRTATGDA